MIPFLSKSSHFISPCSIWILCSFFNLEFPFSATINGLRTLPGSVEIKTLMNPGSFLTLIWLGNSPVLLFSFILFTKSTDSFTFPMNLPLKNTSIPPAPSLSMPIASKSLRNFSWSSSTLVEILLKSARFFLSPISVPSGVSIGQNLP